MKASDEELSAVERAALRELRRDVAPSEALERRVLEALKARAALPGASGPATLGTARFVAFAAAVFFGLGLWVGSRISTRTAPAAKAQTRYVLLLEGPGDPPPEEEARRVEEYKHWARSVAQSGHEITGERLGREISRLGPETSSGGEESVRGFFVVAAGSDREALEIARGCPHLRHGGRIVVRAIDPT
jgi:hypothetical protein